MGKIRPDRENLSRINPRGILLAALVLAAPSAFPDTIYKYRRADGQAIFSNRPVPGAELVETFEYRFPPPAAVSVPANPVAAVNAAEADARIRQYLASLDAAWREVQEAGNALAGAEARLRASEEPQPDEVRALAGPATPAEVSIGGPQPPAPPAAGGPAPVAPASVGGPMGTRRGGGRSPEYVARMQFLENEVQAARTRLDAALRSYNQLR